MRKWMICCLSLIEYLWPSRLSCWREIIHSFLLQLQKSARLHKSMFLVLSCLSKNAFIPCGREGKTKMR